MEGFATVLENVQIPETYFHTNSIPKGNQPFDIKLIIKSNIRASNLE